MVWGGALAGVVSGLHTFGVHHLRSVSLSVTDLCVRDDTHTCLGPRTSFLPVPFLHAHCSPVRFKPAAAASSQAIICEGHGLWWSEPQTLGPGCPGSKPSTAAHVLWDPRQTAEPRLSKDSVCRRGFSKEGKSLRLGTVAQRNSFLCGVCFPQHVTYLKSLCFSSSLVYGLSLPSLRCHSDPSVPEAALGTSYLLSKYFLYIVIHLCILHLHQMSPHP